MKRPKTSKKHTKSRLLMIATIVGSLMAVAAFGLNKWHSQPPETLNTRNETPSSDNASRAKRIPVVTVSQPREEMIIEKVPAFGTLIARETIYVNPEMSGFRIEQILVDVGDQVQQGDVLAILDTAKLETQVDQVGASRNQAQASVSQAQSTVRAAEVAAAQAVGDLQRYQTLRQRGHVTQASLDQFSAASNTAQANVDAARAGLETALASVSEVDSRVSQVALDFGNSQIIAPASGVISARNANIGNIAAISAEPMFQVIRDNLVEANVNVTETALEKLSVGDIARLQITGAGELFGSVRLIEPTVNPSTRLALVRIRLPPDANLRVGSSVSAEIIVDERQALTVDSRSVLDNSAGNYVQVLNSADNQIESRSVDIGLLSGGRREIVNGLALGEAIVEKAGVFLRAGDIVKPILK